MNGFRSASRSIQRWGGTDRGANHTGLPKFRCGGAQHDAPLAAPWVGSVAQSAALTSGWFVVSHVSGGRF